MTQGPERRQVNTDVKTPIRLGMSLEEIEASEVQILLDGIVWETKEVSTDEPVFDVTLTFYNTGERCVEMIAEECLPEEIQELQQQDALDISPPKAHAKWDVTVEPPKWRSIPERIWSGVKELLAVHSLGIIGWKAYRWAKDLGKTDSEDGEDVNRTLDEFREE